MERRKLRIGTRGSALALTQARLVQAALAGPSEITIVRTTGDQRQDVPLDQAGGIGLFTKEIERALLDGEVDLAVHSLKDLPVVQPPGLVLAAVPAREEVADLLLVRPEAVRDGDVLPLRRGALVGTSSTRRRALLAGVRPDLGTTPLRGNVPTRLHKCVDGECDALLLARAGISRLALPVAPLLAFELDRGLWPCAPGQGALGIEARADDAPVLECLAALDDAPTHACVAVERRLLQRAGGGCHSAFGAWATTEGGTARLHLALLDPAGRLRTRGVERPSLDEACDLAAAWLDAGAPEVEDRPLSEAPLCRPAPAWC